MQNPPRPNPLERKTDAELVDYVEGCQYLTTIERELLRRLKQALAREQDLAEGAWEGY